MDIKGRRIAVNAASETCDLLALLPRDVQLARFSREGGAEHKSFIHTVSALLQPGF